MHAYVHVCLCVCVHAAYCQEDNLLGFLLGRLFWHDLDGVLLCGKQGPPPSGICLCTKTGIKRKKKKEKKRRKPPGQAPVPVLLEESVAFSSELPTFCLTKSSSLSQGFLPESRSLVQGARSSPSLPVASLSSLYSL